MMPHEQRPKENQALAPSGRNVQVTVTTVTTVECDAESRLPMDESLLATLAFRSRMEDKSEFHPPGLTEEEQQIRTLEHQMKQDLDI